LLIKRRNKRRSKKNEEIDEINDEEHFDENNLHLRTFENNTNFLILRESDYFVISTGKKQIFKKGQEILNCYGKFSNDYLLKWYGFCYLNNKYDKMKLRVKFPNNEEGYLFFKYLQYIFPRLFLEEENYVVLNFPLKKNFLNLDLIKYSTFYYFYENDCPQDYFSYSFSVEHETKIIENLLTLLNYTQKKKCEISNLEEDMKIYDELITNKSDNFRHKFSLIFRINQKKIINQHIQAYNYVLQVLSSKMSYTDFTDEQASERLMVKQYFKFRKQEDFFYKE